ncbi:duboraya [Nematolebias whitei]|uniref:duboraya n=1 Tax=Nematolebias whitei TaxID=451745 RepID=UPI00189AF101|nr:duboraya [Nematolebias whitei]
MPSSVTPTSPIPTSPLTEEGPSSFEATPSAVEGNILSSINKGRARVSIRRRPPSRCHRKSSGGDEVSDVADTKVISQSEAEEQTGVIGRGGGEEVFIKYVQTDASSQTEKNEEEEEMKIISDGRKDEGGLSSSHLRKEENTVDKPEAVPTEETKEKRSS